MTKRTTAFAAFALSLLASGAARSEFEERRARPGEPYFYLGGHGQLGTFTYRPVDGTGETRRGFQLGGSQAVLAHASWFFAGVNQGSALRVFGSHGLSGAFLYDMYGGLALGPFEPEARVGMDTATIDVIEGKVSVGLLSPRASAGASIRVAERVSIGLFAYGEYLWRWLGPDYWVHGVTLDLRVQGPRYALVP